ncbi:Cytoplasmic dynein 2 heavy chain 1, partial [Aduncisulcus paluster]
MEALKAEIAACFEKKSSAALKAIIDGKLSSIMEDESVENASIAIENTKYLNSILETKTLFKSLHISTGPEQLPFDMPSLAKSLDSKEAFTALLKPLEVHLISMELEAAETLSRIIIDSESVSSVGGSLPTTIEPSFSSLSIPLSSSLPLLHHFAPLLQRESLRKHLFATPLPQYVYDRAKACLEQLNHILEGVPNYSMIRKYEKAQEMDEASPVSPPLSSISPFIHSLPSTSSPALISTLLFIRSIRNTGRAVLSGTSSLLREKEVDSSEKEGESSYSSSISSLSIDYEKVIRPMGMSLFDNAKTKEGDLVKGWVRDVRGMIEKIDKEGGLSGGSNSDCLMSLNDKNGHLVVNFPKNSSIFLQEVRGLASLGYEKKNKVLSDDVKKFAHNISSLFSYVTQLHQVCCVHNSLASKLLPFLAPLLTEAVDFEKDVKRFMVSPSSRLVGIEHSTDSLEELGRWTRALVSSALSLDDINTQLVRVHSEMMSSLEQVLSHSERNLFLHEASLSSFQTAVMEIKRKLQHYAHKGKDVRRWTMHLRVEVRKMLGRELKVALQQMPGDFFVKNESQSSLLFTLPGSLNNDDAIEAGVVNILYDNTAKMPICSPSLGHIRTSLYKFINRVLVSPMRILDILSIGSSAAEVTASNADSKFFSDIASPLLAPLYASVERVLARIYRVIHCFDDLSCLGGSDIKEMIAKMERSILNGWKQKSHAQTHDSDADSDSTGSDSNPAQPDAELTVDDSFSPFEHSAITQLAPVFKAIIAFFTLNGKRAKAYQMIVERGMYPASPSLKPKPKLRSQREREDKRAQPEQTKADTDSDKGKKNKEPLAPCMQFLVPHSSTPQCEHFLVNGTRIAVNVGPIKESLYRFSAIFAAVLCDCMLCHCESLIHNTDDHVNSFVKALSVDLSSPKALSGISSKMTEVQMFLTSEKSVLKRNEKWSKQLFTITKHLLHIVKESATILATPMHTVSPPLPEYAPLSSRLSSLLSSSSTSLMHLHHTMDGVEGRRRVLIERMREEILERLTGKGGVREEVRGICERIGVCIGAWAEEMSQNLITSSSSADGWNGSVVVRRWAEAGDSRENMLQIEKDTSSKLKEIEITLRQNKARQDAGEVLNTEDFEDGSNSHSLDPVHVVSQIYPLLASLPPLRAVLDDATIVLGKVNDLLEESKLVLPSSTVSGGDDSSDYHASLVSLSSLADILKRFIPLLNNTPNFFNFHLFQLINSSSMCWDRIQLGGIVDLCEKLEVVGKQWKREEEENLHQMEIIGVKKISLLDSDDIIQNSEDNVVDFSQSILMNGLSSVLSLSVTSITSLAASLSSLSPLLRTLSLTSLEPDHWVEIVNLCNVNITLVASPLPGERKKRIGEWLSPLHFLCSSALSKQAVLKKLIRRAEGESVVRRGLQELTLWYGEEGKVRMKWYVPSMTSQKCMIKECKHIPSVLVRKDMETDVVSSPSIGGRTGVLYLPLVATFSSLLSALSAKLTLLSSLASSPFVSRLINQTEMWGVRLNLLQQILRTFAQVQRQWLFIEPVMGKGALPEQQRRFESVSVILAEILIHLSATGDGSSSDELFDDEKETSDARTQVDLFGSPFLPSSPLVSRLLSLAPSSLSSHAVSILSSASSSSGSSGGHQGSSSVTSSATSPTSSPVLILLTSMKKSLDIIQKALVVYLERKRSAFPRFYFLSDEDLLKILSQASGKNVSVDLKIATITPHLTKLFQGVSSLQTEGENVVSFGSSVGEIVKLDNPVYIGGSDSEQWLGQFVREMKRSIRSASERGWRVCVKEIFHRVGEVENVTEAVRRGNGSVSGVEISIDTRRKSLARLTQQEAISILDSYSKTLISSGYPSQVLSTLAHLSFTLALDIAVQHHLLEHLVEVCHKRMDLMAVEMRKVSADSDLSSKKKKGSGTFGDSSSIPKSSKSPSSTSSSIPTQSTARSILESLSIDLFHNQSIAQSCYDSRVGSYTNWEYMKQLRYYPFIEEREEEDEGETSKDASSSHSHGVGSPLFSISVCVSHGTFDYVYEYQGVPSRLVYTPLTEKCFVALGEAQALGYGGNPYGPAGTGKTETVKALSFYTGRLVLIFNCDSNVNAKSMGRILKGVVLCGAVACWDEFNRLTPQTMAYIAQQLQNIMTGIKSKTEKRRQGLVKEDDGAADSRVCIELLGEKIFNFKESSGVYVTMNPAGKGYGGRYELPSSIKQLFRAVAMLRPDSELIANVFLQTSGFRSAELLSRKSCLLFSLCKSRLSSQKHYDWGLRALKTVLRSASALLLESYEQGQPVEQSSGSDRTSPRGMTSSSSKSALVRNFEAHEERILTQAVVNSTLCKLTAGDSTVFRVLVCDVFKRSGQNVMDMAEGKVKSGDEEEIDKDMSQRKSCSPSVILDDSMSPSASVPPTLSACIHLAFLLLSLTPHTQQIHRVSQLYTLMEQRMGVMIVGPAGSGKSTLWRVLRVALALYKPLSSTIVHCIAPKSVPRPVLMGYVDSESGEWKDGFLTESARVSCEESIRIPRSQHVSLAESRITKDSSGPDNPVDEDVSQQKDVEERHWVVCDGCVDPVWIESLNSLLDDNCLLSLPSGERIKFDHHVNATNFIFETDSLVHASPATVSRMGTLFMDDEKGEDGDNAVVESYAFSITRALLPHDSIDNTVLLSLLASLPPSIVSYLPDDISRVYQGYKTSSKYNKKKVDSQYCISISTLAYMSKQLSRAVVFLSNYNRKNDTTIKPVSLQASLSQCCAAAVAYLLYGRSRSDGEIILELTPEDKKRMMTCVCHSLSHTAVSTAARDALFKELCMYFDISVGSRFTIPAINGEWISSDPTVADLGSLSSASSEHDIERILRSTRVINTIPLLSLSASLLPQLLCGRSAIVYGAGESGKVESIRHAIREYQRIRLGESVTCEEIVCTPFTQCNEVLEVVRRCVDERVNDDGETEWFPKSLGTENSDSISTSGVSSSSAGSSSSPPHLFLILRHVDTLEQDKYGHVMLFSLIRSIVDHGKITVASSSGSNSTPKSIKILNTTLILTSTVPNSEKGRIEIDERLSGAMSVCVIGAMKHGDMDKIAGRVLFGLCVRMRKGWEKETEKRSRGIANVSEGESSGSGLSSLELFGRGYENRYSFPSLSHVPEDHIPLILHPMFVNILGGHSSDSFQSSSSSVPSIQALETVAMKISHMMVKIIHFYDKERKKAVQSSDGGNESDAPGSSLRVGLRVLLSWMTSLASVAVGKMADIGSICGCIVDMGIKMVVGRIIDVAIRKKIIRVLLMAIGEMMPPSCSLPPHLASFQSNCKNGCLKFTSNIYPESILYDSLLNGNFSGVDSSSSVPFVLSPLSTSHSHTGSGEAKGPALVSLTSWFTPISVPAFLTIWKRAVQKNGGISVRVGRWIDLETSQHGKGQVGQTVDGSGGLGDDTLNVPFTSSSLHIISSVSSALSATPHVNSNRVCIIRACEGMFTYECVRMVCDGMNVKLVQPDISLSSHSSGSQFESLPSSALTLLQSIVSSAVVDNERVCLFARSSDIVAKYIWLNIIMALCVNCGDDSPLSASAMPLPSFLLSLLPSTFVDSLISSISEEVGSDVERNTLISIIQRRLINVRAVCICDPSEEEEFESRKRRKVLDKSHGESDNSSSEVTSSFSKFFSLPSL